MEIKLFIDPGHGGKDPGAVKYIVERDANLVMAMALKEYVEAHGVITKMSRTNNNTTKSIPARAREANKWGADYVIATHNNAGKGDGFEALCSVYGGVGLTLAKNINEEVKKIGQNSRGIKQKKNESGGNYYGMIRLTDAPCVICEGVFVDNATDVKIADTVAEQKEFGYAYARGFLKTVGIKDKGLSGNNEGAFLVKVTADALNIRSGPGTKYKKVGVIKDKGVYTIVETSGSWGKLKSGKGYIHLGYTKKV